MRYLRLAGPLLLLGSFSGCTCSAGNEDGGGGNGAGISSGANGEGGSQGQFMVGGGAEGGQPPIGDPKTCAQAAQAKTYIGCDFWPTPTFNPVYDNFDFAAVVANGGPAAATATAGIRGRRSRRRARKPSGGRPRLFSTRPRRPIFVLPTFGTAMAINGRWNKPIGPGGSTRRLHHRPSRGRAGDGGETGSTRV